MICIGMELFLYNLGIGVILPYEESYFSSLLRTLLIVLRISFNITSSPFFLFFPVKHLLGHLSLIIFHTFHCFISLQSYG